MSTAVRTYAAVLGGVLALDQATKLAVYFSLREGHDSIVLIPGYLGIVHAENRAAAFGMLADVPYRYAMFLVLALVMAVAATITAVRLPPHEKVTAAALGFVAGGALGNGVDRAWKGPVTDFVRVHVASGSVHDWLIANVGTSDWPAFNVADAALFIGIALFVLGLASPDEAEDEPPGAERAG